MFMMRKSAMRLRAISDRSKRTLSCGSRTGDMLASHARITAPRALTDRRSKPKSPSCNVPPRSRPSDSPQYGFPPRECIGRPCPGWAAGGARSARHLRGDKSVQRNVFGAPRVACLLTGDIKVKDFLFFDGTIDQLPAGFVDHQHFPL